MATQVFDATHAESMHLARVTVGVSSNAIGTARAESTPADSMLAARRQGFMSAGLGITLQQVQKYEKGTNRIGAGRLQEISRILQVPVAFFFEDAPSASAPRGPDRSALSIAQIDDFVASSDGLRLIGSPSFLPL